MLTHTGASRPIAGRLQLPAVLPACAAAAVMAGCGGSSGSQAPPPAPAAPPPAASISTQPADQSVPMGLTASFSVAAAASDAMGNAVPLQYQWLRDGKAIAGATSSSYTTPATVFTDSGSQFTVTVSDAGGSVTSKPATLTITARAPNPHDLRFQLVDAPATVNGYGNIVGLFSGVAGRGAFTFTPSIGTPLELGGNCSVPPTTNLAGCYWPFMEYPVTQTGLAVGYGGSVYEGFPADLQGGNTFGINGITPASDSSVVTSLNLQAPSDLYGLSWIQDTTQSGFSLNVLSAAPADLSAAIAQEGQSSRVVTALSYDSGHVSFLSYGWQSDTTTVYETQVSTASTPQTPAAAAALAQQGYIITAIGPADSNGDYYLVGTRVAGDSMPRAFWGSPMPSETGSLQSQGYAVVGMIFDETSSAGFTLLGER